MTNSNWLLLKEEEQKMAHESGDTNIYGISARNNAIDNGELLEWKWQYPTHFPFSSTTTSMTNDLFLKVTLIVISYFTNNCPEHKDLLLLR